MHCGVGLGVGGGVGGGVGFHPHAADCTLVQPTEQAHMLEGPVHPFLPSWQCLASPLHLPSAQQYASPLLKQFSQSLPLLWPRRKLAADALLAKSIIIVPKSAREDEGTRFQTRFTMADLTPDGQGLQEAQVRCSSSEALSS